MMFYTYLRTVYTSCIYIQFWQQREQYNMEVSKVPYKNSSMLMTSRLCFIVSILEGHSPISLSNRSTKHIIIDWKGFFNFFLLLFNIIVVWVIKICTRACIRIPLWPVDGIVSHFQIYRHNAHVVWLRKPFKFCVFSFIVSGYVGHDVCIHCV